MDPYDKDFSGFVFKIKPTWILVTRDRIAFVVRIVSGEFERGMSVNLASLLELPNFQMSPSLWLKAVKNVIMLWLGILSGL